MSDIQRDREERQRVIEILQKEKKTALHDNKWAFDYAINSIETDLKYDLLYEETSGQADKPTTKNDLGVDCISRAEAIKCLECDFDITGKENMKTVVNYINSAHDKIVNLPSVTSQLSSGLEKNSKKLDCISRADAIKAIQDKAKKLTNEDTINGLCGAVAILFDLPSVTPQEPRKGHWVLTDVEGNKVWHCNCSECGKDPQDYVGGSENWWLIKSKLPKFCPTCGSYNGGASNGNE